MNWYPTKNAKYEHVFVVLRIDDSVDGPTEEKIAAVAVFLEQGAAEDEAARLNALRRESEEHNGLEGPVESRYSVHLSRLKGRSRPG